MAPANQQKAQHRLPDSAGCVGRATWQSQLLNRTPEPVWHSGVGSERNKQKPSEMHVPRPDKGSHLESAHSHTLDKTGASPFRFSALMCVRLKAAKNFFFSSKLGLSFMSSGLYRVRSTGRGEGVCRRQRAAGGEGVRSRSSRLRLRRFWLSSSSFCCCVVRPKSCRNSSFWARG